MIAAGRLRDAARKYAEHGWPIFPLHPIVNGHCGCGDRDCENAGKHPITRGWQNTIASPAAVDSLWADRLGLRGIGLACGQRSGMWVLDVDPDRGGDESLTRIALAHADERFPATLASVTGGGGRHLFWKWPEHVEIRNSKDRVARGLDVRGAGGYVVLPPSPHISGNAYRWDSNESDRLKDAPRWLLELVVARKQSNGRQSSHGEASLIPVEQSRDALIWFCGRLRAMGLNEEMIVECGHAFLRHQVEPSQLPLEKCERTMRDIARRYPPHKNK